MKMLIILLEEQGYRRNCRGGIKISRGAEQGRNTKETSLKLREFKPLFS